MDAGSGDGSDMLEEGGGAGEGATEGIGNAVVAGERWVVERREKGIAVEKRGGEAIATTAIGGCFREEEEEEIEED